MSTFIYYALRAVNLVSYVLDTAKWYSVRIHDVIFSDSGKYLVMNDSPYLLPASSCLNATPDILFATFDAFKCTFEKEPEKPLRHSSVLSAELIVGDTVYDATDFFETVKYSTSTEPTIRQYVEAWAMVKLNKILLFDGSTKCEIIKADGSLENLEL